MIRQGIGQPGLPLFKNPGVFYFYKKPVSAGPETHNSDYYKGRVILLVNEKTQSHAEFTCMSFQQAPDVTVIGSQTAGADGNITKFTVPGGVTTTFSSLGIYYPDGSPTQRIGIVSDIIFFTGKISLIMAIFPAGNMLKTGCRARCPIIVIDTDAFLFFSFEFVDEKAGVILFRPGHIKLLLHFAVIYQAEHQFGSGAGRGVLDVPGHKKKGFAMTGYRFHGVYSFCLALEPPHEKENFMDLVDFYKICR